MPRAARTLGTLWEEDLCDFAEVTIGLCRLHEVLRDQSRLSEPLRMHAANDAPQILFGTACGDQHIFGVLVAAECFRRDGWRVWSEPATAPEDLAELVAKVAFDVVALSVTCGSYKERLVGEIAVLRRSSCEPDVKVVIGGRLFAEQPELGEALGADAFLGDVETAPREARKLLAEARVDC
ncbi:MAG: cobalamin B12-binding domain-containing protein [Pseudomonadota bacterium]